MNGVHQKQDKALVTEGEMGRFTKEDIGYLAMKQVSESKVRASPRRCARPPRAPGCSTPCGAAPTAPTPTARHATPRHHTPTRPLASSVTVTVTAAPPQKVKRLRASLHELDAPPKNTHTLFVDSDREAAAFERTLTLTLTLTPTLTLTLTLTPQL